MSDEDKRIWGIHTKDDNLFLRRGVIAIGRDMGDLSLIQANRDSFKRKIYRNISECQERQCRNWCWYVVSFCA